MISTWISLLVGLAFGLAAAFIWLRFSSASPMNKIKSYLPPNEAERLRREVESLEAQIQEAQQEYRLVASHPASLILAADDHENIFFSSPAITALSGFSQDQLYGMQLVELFTPESGAQLTSILDQFQKPAAELSPLWQGPDQPLELIRKDGAKVWVSLKLKLEQAGEKQRQIVCQLHDVTPLRQLEMEWERQCQTLRSQIVNMTEEITQTDLLHRSFSTLLPSLNLEHPAHGLTLCLEEMRTVAGCSGAMVCLLREMQFEIVAAAGEISPELIGRRLPIHEKNPLAPGLSSPQGAMLDLVGSPFPQELAELNRFGTFFGYPLADDGLVMGLLVLFEDTPGALKQSAVQHALLYASLVELLLKYNLLFERLTQLRANDELTGLPNRTTLMETGRREIERARRYTRSLSLILLDLDQFSQINNQFGLSVGDQVLQLIGRCLRSNLREADLVARLGSDEFAILLPETPIIHYSLSPQPNTVAAAAAVAERLRRMLLETPLDTLAGSLAISACFGIAELDPGCSDFPALLHRAGVALQHARQPGQSPIQIWHPEMEIL